MASCTETLPEAEARIHAEAETAMANAKELVAQAGGTESMRDALLLSYRHSITIRATTELARVRAEVDPLKALWGLADPAK